MKCENCGSEITDDAEFCRDCGSKITANSKKVVTGSSIKCPRVWPKILAAVIITAVVIIGGSTAFSYYQDIATTVYENPDYSVVYPEYGSYETVYADNSTAFYDPYNMYIGNILVLNNSEYELASDTEWVEMVNESGEVTGFSRTTLAGQNVLEINYTDFYSNYTFYTFDKGDRTVNIVVNWGSDFAGNWINSLRFNF